MKLSEIKVDKYLLERAYAYRDLINQTKDSIRNGEHYSIYINNDGFLTSGYLGIIAYKELGIKEIETF